MEIRELMGAVRRFWLVALVVGVRTGGRIRGGLPTVATLPLYGDAHRDPASKRIDFTTVDTVNFLLPSLAAQAQTKSFADEVRARVSATGNWKNVTITAHPETGTSILRISAETFAPKTAAVIANAAAQNLIARRVSSLVELQGPRSGPPSVRARKPEPSADHVCGRRHRPDRRRACGRWSQRHPSECSERQRDPPAVRTRGDRRDSEHPWVPEWCLAHSTPSTAIPNSSRRTSGSARTSRSSPEGVGSSGSRRALQARGSPRSRRTSPGRSGRWERTSSQSTPICAGRLCTDTRHPPGKGGGRYPARRGRQATGPADGRPHGQGHAVGIRTAASDRHPPHRVLAHPRLVRSIPSSSSTCLRYSGRPMPYSLRR